MASRWGTVFAVAAFVVLCCCRPAYAEKLRITSNPSGATVEIDGVAAGTTPFEKSFPGGYFHKTKTAMGARLEHAMVARISLAGYATKEILLTDGPMEWIGLNGRNHGEYWLLKSDHFHAELQPIAQVFTGGVTANVSTSGPVELEPELSLEELVRRTKPAVVYLKGLDKAGTGFFVTETGVIATNAHVARGEESLLTLLPEGQQLEAKVVYVDAELDIALAKVEGKGFPHLTLAGVETVRQGESVLAIGNPGDAMLFSVTKGIVSAVGKFANAGPGTWIQTDAPINPGNSGGPLLNGRGEAIGINTQKLIKKNVTGIGFALSGSDLLEVLKRFYPNVATGGGATGGGASAVRAEANAETEKASQPAGAGGAELATPASPSPGEAQSGTTDSAGSSQTSTAPAPVPNSVPPSRPAESFGTVVFAEPEGAEIWVDMAFVGSIPATLKLTAGKHLIDVKMRGHADWLRSITVLKNSKVSLNPDLGP